MFDNFVPVEWKGGGEVLPYRFQMDLRKVGREWVVRISSGNWFQICVVEGKKEFWSELRRFFGIDRVEAFLRLRPVAFCRGSVMIWVM